MGLVFNIFKRQPKPKMKHGEILPADEMKQKYNLTMENYTPPKLNASKVPEEFRDLVPLAQKWGIGDDIIRDDLQSKASEEEKANLAKALGNRADAISQWFNTFTPGRMTDEAAAFMYMLLGLDEMGLYPGAERR
jgi:hypothetical protein